MNETIHFRRNGQSLSVFKHKVEFAGNAFLPQRAYVPITVDNLKAYPVVSFGQYVEEGQLLARAQNQHATDIHSPIPGIIGDVYSLQTDYGSQLDCLTISLEGRFNMLGKRQPNYGWQNSTAYELLRIIEDKGLIYTEKPFISLGAKLRSAIKTDVSVLQFALFDFDISCGLEEVLLSHFLLEIIEGLSIIVKILEVKTIQIFYTRLSAQIKEQISSHLMVNSEVVFIKSKNTYPFYDSRQICLDKDGNSKAFILPPSTALYVYEAIVRDRPFVSSYILFSGRGVKEPKLLKAAFGTSIGSLIEECGGIVVHPASFVINGLISGYSTSDFDIPTSKTIKSVSVISTAHLPRFQIHPCSSCGKCINTCPMHLNPQLLLRKIQTNNLDANALFQLSMCTKCNICSACCECRIPIADIISQAKKRGGK